MIGSNDLANIISAGQLILAVVVFIVVARTFYLQRQTFESQREVSELEQKRFKLELRPVFSLMYQNKYKYSDGPVEVDVILQLEKNIAKQVYIEMQTKDFYDENFHRRRYFVASPGNKITLLKTLCKNENLEKEISTAIYFGDEVDTRYVQIIKGNIDTLKISAPILVSSVGGDLERNAPPVTSLTLPG